MKPEPTRDQICATITHHAARKDASLAALSRMLRHSSSYLSRFIEEGVPERLALRDRAMLAAFFNIDEFELGARPGEPRFIPRPPKRVPLRPRTRY
ncbi:hypothetical protein QH494_15895 [Sphingomonas sp. AR_OL41]|uniref:hypothetical protein n=1 Tax=Sphingomonas sp. AR_OL41 TaxID=3042729 RepID=UPI00247FC427|nr:hypothetical protein [Sphingomonas sp. AR_OL41]MDH7973674.1 hypothetical protein [Sphingomonas sp. AR_OL41]